MLIVIGRHGEHTCWQEQSCCDCCTASLVRSLFCWIFNQIIRRQLTAGFVQLGFNLSTGETYILESTSILIYSDVERIDLASFSRIYVRLKVMAADLGHRHKSDGFNSFLVHLFFWRSTKQRIANNVYRARLQGSLIGNVACSFFVGKLWL